MAKRAFTLLEILVVISIVAILSAIAIPAVSSFLVGPVLHQASQTLTNQLGLARQYATSKNRSVEVRFLRFSDPGTIGEGFGPPAAGQYRAIQLLEVLEAGVPVPIGKTELLPQNIVFCPDERSSLFDVTGTPPMVKSTPAGPADVALPGAIRRNYEFVSFRILPNGTTTLAANYQWFITLVAQRDQAASTALPAHFFTLQIDPVSGTTRSFRPGVK